MTARVRHKRWPQTAALATLLLVFIVSWWLEDRHLQPAGWQRPRGQLQTGEYNVERVIDGDTIILEQDHLRVRLQGIDTPETVDKNKPVEKWGPEASDFTTQFIKSANWRVSIEIDGESVDRYGRHLAFVWHNDKLLNEELVLLGLARTKANFDFSQHLKDRLRQAQLHAKNMKRGIWNDQ